MAQRTLMLLDGSILIEEEANNTYVELDGSIIQADNAAAGGGTTLPIFAHHYNITLKARRK